MRNIPTISKGYYWILCTVLVAFAAVLALPGAARADALTVDCSPGNPSGSAFTSIQDAVNALPAPPPGGRNSIILLSDCTGNVSISGEHRLTLQGSWCSIWCGDPPVKITGASGVNAPVLSISGSQDVEVDNLILTGGSTGLSVGGGSSVTGYIIKAEGNSQTGISVGGTSFLDIWDGDAVHNGQWGIQVGDNSTLGLNGNTPWVPSPQPFLISGNGGEGIDLGGIYADGELNIGGGVTIQDNSPLGIFGAGGGKLLIGAWHGENVIQNNLIGVVCWESAQCITYGPNTIKNNDAVGVQISFGGVGVFLDATTIEGNSMAGVEVTAHSHARFSGHNKVRNNGSTTEPLRAGIRVDGTSQVFLEGGNEVTGNIGPGIVADINSSLNVTDTTISHNTEEGVRVRHMSIAELETGTHVNGNPGGPLTCDSTSWVITTLNLNSSKCANIEGAPGGPRPHMTSGAAIVRPNVQEMTERARQMAEQARRAAERFRGPK